MSLAHHLWRRADRDGRVRLGTVGCDGVVAHMPPPGAVLRVSAFHPDGSFDEGEVLTLGAYAP